MANNQRFSITFDASLNVSQMKGALNDIQKGLNNLHLPQNATKGLQGTFSKLSEEIQKFEVAAGKEIGSKADFSKLEKSASKIGDLFGTLKRQVSELTGLKGKALEKLFPENVSKNINSASKALDNYKATFKNVQNDINKATSSVEKFNKSLERERGKKVVTNEAFKKIEQDSKQAQIDVDNLTQKLQALQQEHKSLGSTLSIPNRSSVYRKQADDIKSLIAELEKAKQKATALSEQKANTTTFDKQAKKVVELTANLTDAQTKLSQFQQIFNQLQNPQIGGLSKLIEQVGRLTGLDMSKFKADAEGVGQAIETYIVQEAEKMSQGLNKIGTSVDNAGTHVQDLGRKMQEAGREMADVDARMREVDALKSRIQYFFGLNNAIELVKRTIRSAFNTVKELDKAMTETAVVTDFSVADMWAQLPDYTKRANDLGVTTKAAYEAATLYYQQGLKTNEVTAMSSETLKMARIAGLDAAVATDRMTNAIRGFNMEINEMNAQRIDDVYSRLAAISASNVDEISTAMTKVASLANNANMEFETTSAFLAQIIETTRESAETAGTALKTVVARFSEVKKLVSEDQLKGQDEEGQLIDVNKVSQALRTAGVDLNKYFLGEVGLDDIFMELASKWDSLTTLQQRYIATQAAGSRQQSRFIALMSDYGRMQELVGEAYNANGAAAEQFAKTQDSLESKLARLKNAWNEFAMGIANSDLIKAGVDILTNLLNFVNKLTDGFGLLTGSVGGFISSILKLGLLIGGLKVGKSLIGGGISGLGALFNGAEGGFSGGFTQAIGAANKKEILKTLLGNFSAPILGIGSLLKGAGGKLLNFGKPLGRSIISNPGVIGNAGSGLAGALGKLGMSSGTAAGIIGMGTTIIGIGAVATGTYLAVKKLYELSPAGQLKTAEKYADTIKKVADEAKKAETSLKDVQTKYKEYSQAISDSTNVQDHSKAIQDRNEYLTSLLEQDASFAKYIQSEVKNGELILSFDEDSLADAIVKAQDVTNKAQAGNLLAQANQAAQKADVLNAKTFKENDSTSGSQYRAGAELAAEMRYYKEHGEVPSTSELNLKLESEAQGRMFQSDMFAQQAASKFVENTTLNDDLKNIIANSYAQVFDHDKFQEALTNISVTNPKSDYEDIYGAGSSKGKTSEELTEAVQIYRATELELDKIDEVIKNLQGSDSSKYEHILRGLAGDFSDFPSLIESISTIPGVFNGEEIHTLELNLDHEALEKIATIYGIKPNELSSQIKNYAQIERERQLQVRDTGYYSLAKGGASNLDIARYLTLDNFEDIELISGLAQKFEDSGIGKEIAHSILDQIESSSFEGSDLQNWLQSLNFDNPIAGAKALHDALQLDDGDPIKQLATSINANEQAMARFSASAQLSYLVTSGGYESLTQSLGEFIEENGEISSANIRELAASNADLNNLLETGTMTAKALAVALEGIETGKFQFNDLNNAVIAALNSMDDLDGVVSNTIDELNGFDPGYDENDITKFIGSAYDTISGNFNKGAYGNNQVASYMQEIFGPFEAPEGADYGESYKAWLQQGMDWLAANKENMFSAWSDFANGLQDNILTYDGKTAEVIQQGGEIIINANGMTTDQLIKAMVSTGKVTEQQAKMMIADFKNYSADFAHELAENDLPGAIEAWLDVRSAGRDTFGYTEQELQTLATMFGVTTDEIKNCINDVYENSDKYEGKKLIPDIDIDLNSYDDLTNKLTQLTGTVVKKGKDMKTAIQVDDLFDGLKAAGIEAEQDLNTALNTMVGDAQEFTATYGGMELEVVRKEGQTAAEALMETYQSVLQQKQQEDFGANFFAGVVKAAAEADINIDPINIPLDINTEELSTKIDKAITELETTKGVLDALGETEASPTVTIDGYRNAISQLNTLKNSLNSFKGTRSLTVTVSGASGLVVNKPGGGKAPPSSGGWTGQTRAKGGHAAPGIALTGEEGPEVVWNKEQGYAYITGNEGPEYQNLQSGDRVFNAQETKKILKRSKKNDAFPSFASGKYPSYASAYTGATKSGVGSSSKTSTKTSSNSEKTSDEWKNELDWLYNLMEDIAESERAQEKLAKQHERYLKDSSKTGKDLYNITKQQMQNLNQQYAYQKQALAGREKEMQEQINQSGYTDYVWWNNNDRTIEINWDKIESIQDKDTYDKVSELVNKAEDIQGKIDAAEDALLDIEDQMKELQERYVQEYVDFEKRVLDAVVNKYQEQIDNLSELNDILNNSNTNILNSIREEVDLQRQIRDNTDTENQIKDMEARLAYLRRDTTGANQNGILQLEKQLEDARQDYSDTLVDQSIDRLSKDNEAAAEQREHQIELLTAQLDYWQKSGALWEEVHNLMKDGISPEGWIRFDSDLMAYLKNTEEFRSMSQAQQEQWIKELENVIAEVNAYTLNKEHPLWDNSTDYMAIMQSLLSQRGKQALEEPAYKEAAAARVEKRMAQGATREQALQEQREVEQKYLGGGTGTSNTVSWNKNTDYMAIMQKLLKEKGINALFDTTYQNAAASRIEKYVALGMGTRAQALQEQKNLEWSSIDFMAVMEQRLQSLGAKALTDPIYMRAAQERANKYVALGMGSAAQAAAEQQALEEKYLKKKGYATGGLARKTGLAWLDGTTNEPEYVLNARQTEAFLRLSEVLPSMFGNTNGSTITNGNVYLELTMNVGEIGSDYDVDRLVNRVKQDIYDASAYRNINVISSIR